MFAGTCGLRFPDSTYNKPAVKRWIVYTLKSSAVGGSVMTSYVASYEDGTFNEGTHHEDTQQSALPDCWILDQSLGRSLQR
jgi:hypothetical protein